MAENKFVCPSCHLSLSVAVGQSLERCPRCQNFLSVDGARTASMESADPDATLSTRTEAFDPGNDPARLGRFEIRRKLGEGAFGTVYEAYDPRLDRDVALKTAKLRSDDASQRVKRFLREAKAAASLRHGNIVPVYEFGQEGEHFYIVSALIRGQTLQADMAARKRAGAPIDLRRAARIVKQLAEALVCAHKLGIVHRDVKPGNVMLDDKDEPMLMDFGLATRPEDAEKLTHAGAVLGTPLYMSPEQARGQDAEATPASDQYSLGVVLYELITGKPPFEGTPEWVMVQHIQNEASSPRRSNPSISRDLETIASKCLQKDPHHRYGDCQELVDDLGRYLEGKPVRARPVSPFEHSLRWARRHPAEISAIALSLLILVLGIYVATRTPDVPTVEPPRVEVRQPIRRQFDYVEVDGIILPKRFVELKADAAGLLEQIRIRGGEYVALGEPLFDLVLRNGKEKRKIAAPINGFVSRPKLDVGNPVVAGEVLANLESVDVKLDFKIDENRLAQCRDALEKRAMRVRYQKAPMGFVGEAQIDDIDLPQNGIAKVECRISMPPDPKKLPPYHPRGPTRVRLPADSYERFMVPESAIQSIENRKLLRVLGKDDIVKQIEVNVGDLDSDGLRGVYAKKGGDSISDQEWVIVEGLEQTRINYPVIPIKAGKGEPAAN